MASKEKTLLNANQSQSTGNSTKQSSMDGNEKSDPHNCLVYHQDALLVCKACKGLPDESGNVVDVYYCGAACQKEDWPSHKVKCKAARAARDRHILHRAGELAQALWMLFCRKTWQWVVEDVEEDFGPIEWIDLDILYYGKYWDVCHGRRTAKTKNYFLDFPVEKFPDVQQQEALLTQSRCKHALCVMDNIVKNMLKDKTRAPIPAHHLVFKIILPNKDSYAFDFTAPQYGWYGPTTLPWSTFEEERLDFVKNDAEHGWSTTEFLKEASEETQYAFILLELRQSFNDSLAIWQQQHGSFQELLGLSQEEFCNKKTAVLTYMEKCISKDVTSWNKRVRVAP
ncbi:MAG: hypothetical protein Q9174_006410 [Haloplaca sp. 1 TL-2023]